MAETYIEVVGRAAIEKERVGIRREIVRVGK